MRLFTAIDLPDDLLMRLERMIAVLRPEALLKWSPLDNIHLTTKFIGEWPEARLRELIEALQSVCNRPAFELEVKGFGWFPKTGAPRVLWSGVDGGEALQDLVRDTETALTPFGIQKELHPFVPHITLARVQGLAPLERLREKLAAMQPGSVGSFAAPGFYLYESRPGSNASLYRKLFEYRFESAVPGGA